jgi:hypothetical protein
MNEKYKIFSAPMVEKMDPNGVIRDMAEVTAVNGSHGDIIYMPPGQLQIDPSVPQQLVERMGLNSVVSESGEQYDIKRRSDGTIESLEKQDFSWMEERMKSIEAMRRIKELQDQGF